MIFYTNVPILYTKLNKRYDPLNAANASLKQSEERRILRNDQSKNTSKYLQREVDRTQYFIAFWHLRFSMFQTRRWSHSLTLKSSSYASVAEENATIMCRRRPWEREARFIYLVQGFLRRDITTRLRRRVRARHVDQEVREWWIIFETFWAIWSEKFQSFSRNRDYNYVLAKSIAKNPIARKCRDLENPRSRHRIIDSTHVKNFWTVTTVCMSREMSKLQSARFEVMLVQYQKRRGLIVKRM